MVRGLDRFRDHFRMHKDRYVLIGGVACDVAFAHAGVAFRATKDADIVLCVESLDAAFARAFWEFVEAGGYELQASAAGEKKFYRFKKPARDDFPVMLELFARAPDAIGERPGAALTPIPFDEDVSSLSAILLDAAYYGWIQSGKHELDGLTILRPEHLIPLKAKAWLDLRARSAAGQKVDAADVRKHRNDVFRLFAIIDPEFRASLPMPLRDDMSGFFAEAATEPVDLKAMGLRSMTLDAVLQRLRSMYGLATT